MCASFSEVMNGKLLMTEGRNGVIPIAPPATLWYGIMGIKMCIIYEKVDKWKVFLYLGDEEVP